MVLGKNGQLGFELSRSFVALGDVTALGRDACDLAHPESVRNVIRDLRPDLVVNAAAYTSVDKAESTSEIAGVVNGITPGIIGEECRKLGALAVHYSTDYVFDGTSGRPYVELDVPNPLNVYGRSKLEGELALARSTDKYLILRTSWVVGSHGGNFARTILRLAMEKDVLNVVSDQWGAPTPTPLIAEATMRAVRRLALRGAPAQFGLYHLTAAGQTNWHDYARHIVRRAQELGIRTRLQPDAIRPVTSQEYPTVARRPENSRLDTKKFCSAFEYVPPEWTVALEPVLNELLRQL